ncbi:kelch domain-containing protein 9-like [Physella acuta]|uniref:kelch domain-containing protein 9-like n=1 Tax=Physella acuta TaxID=109671 RepID=UPI0027DBE792|nr:kelch domain-containing protein 9-like [Physella acuta]
MSSASLSCSSRSQYFASRTIEGKVPKLKWIPIAPLGPKAAFHAGDVIKETLYVHGGLTDSSSVIPSNQFYRLDLKTNLWEKIRTKGSPALSHHAAVVLEDRYFVLIGGWDGKKRCASIHVYDTVEDHWQRMNHSGFPSGAGLSSHTACALENGDIVVIGREGSLRSQRKHGNMYILSGTVTSGSFVYKEFHDNITSRSGHTSDVIGNSVFIVGGRSDLLLEKVVGLKSTASPNCEILQNLLATINSIGMEPMVKLPCGRKSHVSACGDSCILIHGGETFDGKSHEPVGEMFLISFKPTTKFFKLNSSKLHRAGHVCVSLPDKVIFHGGKSGKSTINSNLYELKLSR